MRRPAFAAMAALLFAGAAQAATTELVIYKNANFRGQSDTIKGEVANLENGFGHEVSSLIARGGAWEVCTGDHFKGRCRTLAEGEYPTLGGLNERIVSVRFLGADARVARNEYQDSNGWYRSDGARREARRRDDAANAYVPRQEPYTREESYPPPATTYGERRYDNYERPWYREPGR